MTLKHRPPIVKRSLISWILRGNSKLKLLLLLVAVVTVLIRVIPLEMQKRIVNQAISLKVFDLLLVYCGIYLAAVVCAGALKYAISYLQDMASLQGILGSKPSGGGGDLLVAGDVDYLNRAEVSDPKAGE